MSAAQQRHRLRALLAFDPLAAAVGCIFAAAAAAAVATAISPNGYQLGSRLVAALLFGAVGSLLLLFVLTALLARRFTIARSRALYTAMVAALVLLLAVAGARLLLSRTTDGTTAGAAAAERAFRAWALQAVPLLVRYKDALAADSSQSRAGAGSGRDRAAIRARVEQAGRRLLALESPLRRLTRSALVELRPFMPQLARALRLAVAAQQRYEVALAAHGRRAGRLRRQANRLLVRSQEAMTSFSFQVNGVGARLANATDGAR